MDLYVFSRGGCCMSRTCGSILLWLSQLALLCPGAAPSPSRRQALSGVLQALSALLHGTASHNFRAILKAPFQQGKVIETIFS